MHNFKTTNNAIQYDGIFDKANENVIFDPVELNTWYFWLLLNWSNMIMIFREIAAQY